MVWQGAALPTDHLTDVMPHSSIEYHQEQATEHCRLHKDVAAVCGAVIYVPTEFPHCTTEFPKCSRYSSVGNRV